VFMEFQGGRGVPEIALLLEPALGLDFVELVRAFLELAGEPLRVLAEGGQQGDQGWGLGDNRSASRSGMKLRRQAVSASSWASWVSAEVAGWNSSRNRRQWSW
jgi:hypothetical protein